MRTVTIAAAQVETALGDLAGNLARAEALVAMAAGQGADLVVLPELFGSGYVPNRKLWRYAETPDGPTASWLRRVAQRHAIHIGGGYAAWEGHDVVNVFSLAGPDGTTAGTARKGDAEAFVFRRGGGVHVIDTALGRIGVGICADNQRWTLLAHLRDRAVDLVLMPHAWPAPVATTRVVSESDIRAQHEKRAGLPLVYARALGVPVVLVNHVGPMGRLAGVLGRLLDPAVFRLDGGSSIVDSDGTVVGTLDAAPGVVVRDVVLDPARRTWVRPPSYDGWVTPGNPFVRRVVIPFDIAAGVASYRLHARTRRRLAAASGSRVISTWSMPRAD